MPPLVLGRVTQTTGSREEGRRSSSFQQKRMPIWGPNLPASSCKPAPPLLEKAGASVYLGGLGIWNNSRERELQPRCDVLQLDLSMNLDGRYPQDRCNPRQAHFWASRGRETGPREETGSHGSAQEDRDEQVAHQGMLTLFLVSTLISVSMCPILNSVFASLATSSPFLMEQVLNF